MRTPRAPQPDPMIGQAALENAATSREMLEMSREDREFAREQYEDQLAEVERIRPIFDALAQGQISQTNLSMDITRGQWGDYQETFRPIERRVAEEAMAAGSEGEQELAAGRAGVDVQRGLDMQREISGREMASMGVNPNSGRWAGMGRSQEIMGAAVRAGSETQARAGERLRGEAMRSAAAAMGRGMTGTALTGVQISGNAAASAAGMAGAGANARGAVGQTYLGNNASIVGQMGTAADVNASAAGIMNDLYGNRVAAYQAQQQSSSGMGSALGTIGGMMMMSDEDAKEDKEPISEDDAREAIDNMRIEKWRYKKEVGLDRREHIGTYAQDFKKYTGLGDGRTIHVVDAVGVNMAATKALSRDVRALRRVVSELGVAA